MITRHLKVHSKNRLSLSFDSNRPSERAADFKRFSAYPSKSLEKQDTCFETGFDSMLKSANSDEHQKKSNCSLNLFWSCDWFEPRVS